MTIRNQSRWHRWPIRAALGCAALIVFYAASYSVLSFSGGWVVSESGELRPFGLAAIDIFQWQPRYGRCQWFRRTGGIYGVRADALGYLYAPLVLLDQHYVHRTIRFMRPDGSFVEPLPAPPYSEYHPLLENRFARRFPYEQPSHSK